MKTRSTTRITAMSDMGVYKVARSGHTTYFTSVGHNDNGKTILYNGQDYAGYIEGLKPELEFEKCWDIFSAFIEDNSNSAHIGTDEDGNHYAEIFISGGEVRVLSK